jgi:hypothetical protein
MEMDKKMFFQNGHNGTVEKLNKCLHFISIFIPQKLILGLVIQYASLNRIQKISLKETCLPGLEILAVSGL